MAATKLLEARPTVSRDRPSRLGTSSSRAAAVLGVIALVAAALAAVGPAEKVRTTYSWPPPALPDGTPSQTWYAPLLLAAQSPISISADIPCHTGASLHDREATTILSTARFPERVHSFVVSRADRSLTFRVGGGVLAHVPAFPASSRAADCSYQVRLQEERWSVSGGPDSVDLGAELDEMPVVTGLFSELDLRAGPGPSADVTTAVHATRGTVRQNVGWFVASIACLAALLLVAFGWAPRRSLRKIRNLAKQAARGAHAVDAVVGIALVAWWVLSPAFFDDGWVIGRQRAFSASRGFSNYYDGIGTNLPNGYWLEWLQHWTTQSFDALLFLRVPTLLCLVATWLLGRWTLARILTGSRSGRGVAVWALAGGFIAGAAAWGMTLRPEPVIALLATAALACAVQFSMSGTAAPLAIAAVVVPLAVTGHHSGVVALAPMIAVAPRMVAWARRNLVAAAALSAVAISLVVVLAFVGSDVAQRVADGRAIRAYGSSDYSWRDEIVRYAFLSDAAGTPLRRGWVAIALLTALAFVLRRAHARSRLDLPAVSLGLGFVLLLATPSKWPWHWGALIGVAAVAIAAETVRLRRDANETSGWNVRPFVVTGAALLALVWALSVRQPWNPLDLQTLDWVRSSQTPLSLPIAALGAFLALSAAAVVVTQRRAQPLARAPWEVASWSALVVTLPLIAFTVGILAVDAAKTESWTLTRQNLVALRGDPGCGLADQLSVPVLASVRALPGLDDDVRPPPPWLPPAPAAGLNRFVLGPTPGGEAVSPWFQLSPDRRAGIFVAGGPGQYNALAFEWGRARSETVRVEVLGRADFDADAVPDATLAVTPWQFVTASQLPDPAKGADVVRVALRKRTSFGSTVGVTSPVTYSKQALEPRVGGPNSTSLVYPAVRPYFPCVNQPLLEDGQMQAPEWIVATLDQSNPLEVGRRSSFAGALDLYRLERLPLNDSENAPTGLVVFRLDRHIPGGLEAPAVAATTAS